MKCILLAAVAALGLAGCTARLATGNEVGGLINNVNETNLPAAAKIADDHCRPLGKAPKLGKPDILTNVIAFECVSPR